MISVQRYALFGTGPSCNHSHPPPLPRCISATIGSIAAPVRITKPESYKARVTAFWEARSATYKGRSTFHNRLAQQLVELAQLQPGQTVLDVAAGTGFVSLQAAALVGPEGHVTALDISPGMLDQARQRAKDEGLANLTFHVADAEAAEFPGDNFDAIICSSALVYLQHVPQAISTFFNWLKTGGKLVFNTPQVLLVQNGSGNEHSGQVLLRVRASQTVSTMQEPAVPGTLVLYRLMGEKYGVNIADACSVLKDAPAVISTLKAAGFSRVQVTEHAEVMLYKGLDALGYAEKVWQQSTGSVFTPSEHLLTPEQLDDIKPIFLKEVVSAAQAWVQPEGVDNTYNLICAVAQK